MKGTRALSRVLYFRSGISEHVKGEIDRERKATARLEQQLRRVQESHAAAEERIGRLKEQVHALEAARLTERVTALEYARQSDQRDRLDGRIADLESMFPVASLQAHVRQVIARSTLESDPYPHLVLVDVLPDAYHKMLYDARPPRGYWHSGQVGRENWTVGEDIGPLETEAIWRYMDNVIAPRVLMPELTSVFTDYLSTQYGRPAATGSATEAHSLAFEQSGGRLMLRRPGYHFEPHLDPHRAMLTALLYFGTPNDSHDYGTMLYKTDQPLPEKHRGVYYPLQEGASCDWVKTVPSRPNSMLVFASRIGLHGADIPADAQPPTLERYTYQFYIGKPRHER